MATVAVTGVSGLIGRRLVAELDSYDDVDRIVGIDVRAPAGLTSPKLAFAVGDVRDPHLAGALEGADVVVHLAFRMDPTHDEATAHAVNVGGSRNVAEAAVRAGVRKLVHVSSAVVYGAHADNDFPLTEASPLRANGPFPYAEHTLEVEEWLWPWARAHPDLVLTVLRPSVVAGPGVQNFMSRMVEAPRFTVVKGHKPPLQFVHVDDVAAAIGHVVRNDLAGAYNVSSEGWLSFDEVTALIDRKVLEVPEEVAFSLAERLWELGVGEAPPGQVHYLMHPWVVATDELMATGWRPRHSNRDALVEALREHADWLALAGVRVRRSMLRGGAAVAGAGLAGLLLLARARRRAAGATDPGA